MDNEGEIMKTRNILTAILIVIAVVIAVMFYRQNEKALNAYICDSSETIVNEGVTLYDIVQAQCDGNLSEALDDVVDTYGTNLSVGQRIFLPRNNDCQLRMTDGGEVWEDCP
jgi:hypothetical protein